MLLVHSQQRLQHSQIDLAFYVKVNSLSSKLMANKIISFNSTNESFIGSDLSSVAPEKQLEVFTDISMEASLNGGRLADNKWKVEKNVNVKAIFGSLRNIFTWTPGERILLPEFGSRLRSLLYEGITQQTEERIATEIRSCVSEWEPRVTIVEIRNVSTVDDTEDNTIHLEVVFKIPRLSDEQYTYSFSYNRTD